jgi:release factor glutamine methyltransferase
MAEAVARLAAAGCDTPRLDAELLLADALGVDRARLYTERYAEPEGFADRIRRRAGHEPVAYITGRRAFRRIELHVDRRVLIPRPDTETLVEAALGLPSGARVHDVGTGSGAVALALKDERPDLVVSASDASPGAVEVARANAERLQLDVAIAHARGLPPGAYDLVVANLPYVREGEWDGLEPDIRLYEPPEALLAGPDGLDAIRELIATAPAGTPLALEHAPDQSAAVRALLRDARTLRDLSGRDRVTTGTVP